MEFGTVAEPVKALEDLRELNLETAILENVIYPSTIIEKDAYDTNKQLTFLWNSSFMDILNNVFKMALKKITLKS